MPPSGLLRLLPGASPELCDILDGTRGPAQPPIRSEIFGLERFARHGRSLGETHRATRMRSHVAAFFPRLRNNIRTLREAHRYLGLQASTGYDLSPAAEWLLDNFHLIEAQLKEIHEGLPRRYFHALPTLIDEPLAGLPRVYGVAWAFVAHTDGAFDDALLTQFLDAYNEVRELSLGEMWALPTTLRVVLVENLRRLAERVATGKAAREAANLCCDHIEALTTSTLDTLLGEMTRRGVEQTFLVQMGQRLQDHRVPDHTRYREWLRNAMPELARVQTQLTADQAADNLSVSNAVTSLRAIGDADWPGIVERTSALMRLMLTSATFKAESAATRDRTLHRIEALARRSRRDEVSVARTLLDRMRANPGMAHAGTAASYWLHGEGATSLLRALGLPESRRMRAVAALARSAVLPAYLGALVLGTVGLVTWMVLRHGTGLVGTGDAGWLTLIAAALMLFPASEAVVAVINRLISESVEPAHLPRLALPQGIPLEHRVLVAIPALLTNSASIGQLAHRLLLHHLANPERHAQFALLTDWADAAVAHAAPDDALLAEARARIRDLNARYPAADDANGGAPRFILLHRERSFSESEQCWIGDERKRGKLELLVAALAEGDAGAFLDLGRESRIAPDTPYLVTLDSDTQLPPGRLRDLVGVAAHPDNQPRIDPARRIVTQGYGILQPRVVTPLPAPQHFTLFHWLFAGQCGIDPYSAATSEVYQDLFREGTFTGKGLLNVRAMHAVLSGRLPKGQVLSHDLLEGSLARCAAVTDITVIEDAPFHADVAAARMHRWTRGDWQLLPFLLAAGRYRIRAINRWKMFDNLRRSLVAPVALALILVALAGAVVSPWAALALVMAAFCAGPLMGAVAGFAPSRDDIAKQHFYRRACVDLARALWGGLWHLAQLLQQALMASDAIVRAIYRMTVSHRQLLQWTTAAAAQASAQTSLAALVRRHRAEPVAALVLLGTLLAAGTPTPWLAVVLCLVWGAAPISTWWVSRERPARRDDPLSAPDRSYLEGVARESWRLFERCVGPEDHHLPPDNLQTLPHDLVAHRTSPTNIGLYLLSVACARQFGWVGTQELLARVESTLATLASLTRHRGHFLNWYDTQTLDPLTPMYVSTVDSGNLSGHLLAVAQACRELAHAPYDTSAAQRAVRAVRLKLAPLLPRWSDHLPPLASDAALAQLLLLADPLAECGRDPVHFERLVRASGEELDALSAGRSEPATPARPSLRDQSIWELADLLATLRSACQDALAARHAPAAAESGRAGQRLRALAHTCEELAWQPEFGFLYHRRRHLLHIGYRVAEQQLDAGFYDLLVSEARLTSLIAIAKGDVPVTHWTSLGRLFYAVGPDAGLRSWSGSMFEYLMPTLVLEEPYGSVLRDAGHAALREQITFAAGRDVPWGISESAYAASDHTLAYQYAPQGVPRLALRRTPPDELVIAPYATALAAQIAPHRACRNFAALEERGARDRYGFIEALDYSHPRQTGRDRFTPVRTFMAHHQGMSIVALANTLFDGVARRWGMANAAIEAVASLLHERAPREVSMLYAPSVVPPPQAPERRASRLVREVTPGAGALEPTHVLSNGRYSVTVRANGAGWSRRGPIGITRWRDDALRDAFGSFFYLRWLNDPDRSSRPVSITRHPAPDPAAHYKSVFHADRVCFDAAWPEFEAHATVWVSPEDDIEFREVELRNLGDRMLDIELLSSFEVTLADPRADEAHPAFTNLFVRAQWRASHQALVFERTPRLATEQALQAAHFIADAGPEVVGVRVQADRQRWLGRNRNSHHPLAMFDEPPTLEPGVSLDTGLDPVCALSVRLRIAPNATARLTFATTASDDGGVVSAVIDKYRQTTHVQRASLMSATLSGIRLRALRVSPEDFAAIQLLTTALVLVLTRPGSAAGHADDAAIEVCDRSLLWRFGLSGDRPIILVSASAMQGMGLLRSLAQALQLWMWGGVACDLVVVNAEPASYHMALHREITALRERHGGDGGAPPGPATTGFHVLRADELSIDELGTLRAYARLSINADGRSLAHHVQEWAKAHARAFGLRGDASTSPVPTTSVVRGPVPAPVGTFAASSGEFRFHVGENLRPVRPWINVLSNAAFGAQLSEAGGGYTWAVNSRLNQLTAWSNDPVADPPAEWFLIQDRRTFEAWSVTPSAWGDRAATYRVAHGQGYTVIGHRRGEVEVTASWCVDPDTSVKQVHLRIVNHGHRPLRLRVIGIAEWMMGANRVDRATVRTAPHRQRLAVPEAGTLDPVAETTLNALFCTQRERSAGFGDGTAFLATVGASDDVDDWTCDRRECFDADGNLQLPDTFGKRHGIGFDPCAVLATSVVLEAGDAAERVFLLGYAATPDAARELAMLAAATSAHQRMEAVRTAWDRLLGVTTVKTPDPLFDAMVNRWLLYQTVSCRLWAKAGFYQAGGATGFRDQLQDALALAWSAPAMLREQIVLAASRQFDEGDVQHWWHAPTGAGVRTRFSDDLLWLAHACVHYVRVTGDVTLLDQRVPFIEGAAIPEGAEDAYYTPVTSTHDASVYEHAARAIDRSLRVGAHGLPLMGTGDWNDGMNRVGHEGHGESVWLGWFLCRLVADFVPLARARGDTARATRWERAAQGWQRALTDSAWDGQWFKRAFFDDGTALGSHENAEARIDLIAQAWSVLSGAAPPALQRMALAAVENHLVDPEAGLIRLLDPPLAHARPSAGYIQAYPPGVRENGGQYSHAGVWALMAQAEHAAHGSGARHGGDTAYRYFTYLSPAHRARHPTHGAAYGVEPYVMAGDVYTEPPYVGRGGWSWYTGAAAWMHRAAIESIFGLRLGSADLSFVPCLPSHWSQAEITLVRDGRTMRFILFRASAPVALEATAKWGATLLRPGQSLPWPSLAAHTCFVIPLPEFLEKAPPAPHSVATQQG